MTVYKINTLLNNYEPGIKALSFIQFQKIILLSPLPPQKGLEFPGVRGSVR